MQIIYIVLILSIVILDQWTKKIAICKLKNSRCVNVFKGKLQFFLLKNTGAAFNIFSGKRKFLIGVTFSAVIIMGYYLLTLLMCEGDFLLKLALSLVLGGGIGNLIDRIKKRYVIDFIYFNIKRFPVFNIADFFVFGGEFIIIYLMIIGQI